MERMLKISNRVISDDTDCYVIAEIGHNHQGDIEKARKLILEAKNCGVDAVKFQKRNNKKLYTKAYYDRPYENENSFGKTYGEHREFLEFGKSEYEELKSYAEELGVAFFATAFDFDSADFLADLDVPAYKIASGDLTNIPLIKYIARFGKPLIISTGGGSVEDVQRVYDEIMPINSQISFLQCTAKYPSEPDEMNLNVIQKLRERYPEIVIGLSDHFNGIVMALIAFILGSRIVEKHFTLNHTWKGTDHALSLEPIGMRKMVRDLRRARVAIGDGTKIRVSGEESAIFKMGKKLVAAKALRKHHRLTAEDVAIKSPGDGLPPYELDNVIGKRLKSSLKPDDNILFSNLMDD